MKFDYGTWIAIGAVLFFYLRLIILQRKKARQYARSIPPETKSAKKQPQSAGHRPQQPALRPHLLAMNMPLIVTGVLLILSGAALAGLPALSSGAAFWWLPVTLGIVLLGLGFQ